MSGQCDGSETVVCWTMVSIVFVCLFSSGCKRRVPVEVKPPLENVITNRMNDAAYLGNLRKNRTEQAVKANEWRAIVAQMRACSERVKATLPKDAGEAALTAALAKDEVWRKLEAQNTRMTNAIQQVLLEARQQVRQRMLEEARAIKAVEEGKAKAVDQTADK